MQHRRFSMGMVAALAVACGLAITHSVESQTTDQTVNPRLPNGKPDLNGMWISRGDSRGEAADTSGGFTEVANDEGITRLFPSRRCAPNQEGCRDNTNQSNDGEFTGRTNESKPQYKPKYWDKVQFLDYDTNFSDPAFDCQPLGVPRVGPPTRIVQTDNDVIFLYAGGDHDYRIIPMDGRSHNPEAFPSYWGESVGHWEGDTLVVDARGFSDITWLDRTGGYFHGYELRVIERVRREGNTLHYQATVEDPEVLLEPWAMNPRRLTFNANSKATIAEGRPCRNYNSELTVNRIRH